MTLKNLPGSEPDVSYGYDLLDRLTNATQTNNALSFGWDALGRNLTQGGPQGTVGYTHDVAGRRTSMVYPGVAGATALTVHYDYDAAGNVKAIRGPSTGSVGVVQIYDVAARRRP